VGDQEYLYNSEYVTVSRVLPDEDDLVIVENDHGELIVARFSDMERKEDSYYYRMAEERKVELQNITKKAEANLNKIADRVVDRALNSLASRMKFNLVFGKAGEGNNWVMPIVDELHKMIKDKSKETMKDFEL
jgi:hypothetical protein